VTVPARAAKPSSLARYDAMCRAIEAAYKVDEVKDIRDQAIALEVYARQAHNTEAERKACEIRLRAERKAGPLSKELERSPGGRPAKTPLAAVPEKEFEMALADPTAKPTTNGIIKANMEPKPNPVSAEALWLWGRLRDFRRDGLLDKTPQEVMATMTPAMRDEVHTLAPRVAAWLKKIGALQCQTTSPPNVCETSYKK
jgi:hypothetical protein